MDTSFLEIKRRHGQFELFLNKKIGKRRNQLLIERSEILGVLIRKCKLNGPLGRLQANAK